MCFMLREWWTSRCDIGVASIRNTRPGAPSSPTSLTLLLPHLLLPPSSSSPSTSLPLSAFLACVIYEEFALSLWMCLYNNVAGASAGVSLLCTCVFSSDCAPSWTPRASSLWLQQLLGERHKHCGIMFWFFLTSDWTQHQNLPVWPSTLRLKSNKTRSLLMLPHCPGVVVRWHSVSAPQSFLEPCTWAPMQDIKSGVPQFYSSFSSAMLCACESIKSGQS